VSRALAVIGLVLGALLAAAVVVFTIVALVDVLGSGS
jgi:hypothetical protein